MLRCFDILIFFCFGFDRFNVSNFNGGLLNISWDVFEQTCLGSRNRI